MDGDESTLKLQVQLQPKSDIVVKKPTAPTFIGDHTTVKCTVNYNYNPGLQNDEGYERPAPHQVPKRIEYFNGRSQLENNSGVSIKVKDLNLLIRQKLCKKLDIKTYGVDGGYETLAGHLDMPNDDFQLISQGQEPTEYVLRWWERKPEATIAKLRDILRTMGRSDCVDILDQAQELTSEDYKSLDASNVTRQRTDDNLGKEETDCKSCCRESLSSVPPEFNEKETEEIIFLNKVDKEIKKLPSTSFPLLKIVVEKICETQNELFRKECGIRVNSILDWLFDTENLSENVCGIYRAEKIIRNFLMTDFDTGKVLSCISIYNGILTVLVKHGGLPKFNNDLVKSFLNDLNELLARSPPFCPYRRTRRDTEAVTRLLSTSVRDQSMLKKAGKFLCKIHTDAAKDNYKTTTKRFCKKYLDKKDWCQHFLIISWLKMQVVNKKKKNFLQIVLQVIAYFSKKLRKQSRSYQWKFTLTVVDSLTHIATIVPELSTVAIVGDMNENSNGLIDFLKLLKDQQLSECIEIFYLYTRTLVYIENVSVRRLLLTGIFKELDVSSEEILKERLKRSPSMRYLSLSGTLHYGENSLIMSGCFRGSPVVAKCYKQHRDELIAKTSRSAGSVNFANEAFMLSYLQKGRCHLNIVRLRTYDEGLSVLVLQYVSQGCLLKILRNRRTRDLSPNLTDLYHMLIQITDALVYLEKEQVLHLGIKAKNVLLGENYQVQLTGFQFSRTKKVIENAANELKIVNRHLKWMAPERLIGGEVSHASDVWSFGVLMYEVLTFGCVPYNHPTSNPKHGDFRHKPMTATQARLFVLREGRLPKHPCIPETLFQVISDRCCPITNHGVRATAAEVRDLLQMQHSELKERMKVLPSLGNMPPPPELYFFKEDVNPGDYNPGADSIADQDEDFPFIHLDRMDFAWNEEIPDSVYDDYQETYTNLDPAHPNPIVCSTKGYNQNDDQTDFIVLEYKEFRDIKHAEKLRALNHSSLVKVLAVNRFGPVKLEMISQYIPRGNILAALLSTPSLRQHLVLYMKQAACALIYLHKHKILHRDLRAENILLENEMQIKVGRLGFSKKDEDVNATYVDPSDLMLQSACAAHARWNPTEVVKNGTYSKESDYWSFGIVFWELSKASTCSAGTSKEAVLPYKDHTDNEVYSFVKLGGRLLNPDTSSNTLYDIYKGLWAQETKKRCSIGSVLDELESVTNESVSSIHEEMYNYYEGNNDGEDLYEGGDDVLKVYGCKDDGKDFYGRIGDAQDECSNDGELLYQNINDVPKVYECSDDGEDLYEEGMDDLPKVHECSDDGEDLYEEGMDDVPKVHKCSYDGEDLYELYEEGMDDVPKVHECSDDGEDLYAEGMDDVPKVHECSDDGEDLYAEGMDDVPKVHECSDDGEDLYEGIDEVPKVHECNDDGEDLYPNPIMCMYKGSDDVPKVYEGNADGEDLYICNPDWKGSGQQESDVNEYDDVENGAKSDQDDDGYDLVENSQDILNENVQHRDFENNPCEFTLNHKGGTEQEKSKID